MSPPPAKPRIYHITHLNNVASIVKCGCIWSDADKQRQGFASTNVGMSGIKERRLALPVKCHPGTTVGQYVPFYYCPRSVMLYLLHRGNHPNLAYTEGQRPIVHLQADLQSVVQWADQQFRRWAFTACNAGAYYTDHHKELSQLHLIDWDAVGNNNFSDSTVKEGKQAEFLLHEFFPWSLVEEVGVHSLQVRTQVEGILTDACHRPPVTVRREWYY